MRTFRKVHALALILITCCRGAFDPTADNPDWSPESHAESVPQYAVVFPQDSVNRIDIVMTAAAWASLRANMTRLWGFDFGAHDHPCCGPYAPDADYIDVLVRFNGKTWKHVGFRPKGNSSLHLAWNAGNYKLPFRLKFDAFGEQHRETSEQRFYGFKEVTFASGGFDSSLVRERVAGDLFRQAGVPAARAAFYRVYIDFGEGLDYNGLYTMVEVIEDQMLLDQFGEDGGTLYKPFSHFDTFESSAFPPQSNKKRVDYSDVEALIAILNDQSLRTGNPAQWRSRLEGVFNVDHFLNYLAVNTTIKSWDAYGNSPHNFFLYHHSSGKLTWIPWDQDYTFDLYPYEPISLSLTEVDASWPLIRYLADDPVYYARYREHLRSFYHTVFTEATVNGLFDKYHAMIAPYVIGPNGERPDHTYVTPSSFTNALPLLKNFVTSRRVQLAAFLGDPGE
jgi:hypothetical protein